MVPLGGGSVAHAGRGHPRGDDSRQCGVGRRRDDVGAARDGGGGRWGRLGRRRYSRTTLGRAGARYGVSTRGFL